MTTITADHAAYYKLPPQAEGESDSSFRHRVAGALRDTGKIIEAHEAQQDARYDNDDSGRREAVMDGLVGAMAQALHRTDYRVSGADQVGLDIAAGVVSRAPQRDMSLEALMMAALLGRQ